MLQNSTGQNYHQLVKFQCYMRGELCKMYVEKERERESEWEKI